MPIPPRQSRNGRRYRHRYAPNVLPCPEVSDSRARSKIGAPDRYQGIRAGRSPGLSTGTQVMRQEKPGRGGPLGPLDWRKFVPFEPAAASDRLGWVGLEAARYRATPAHEL